MILHYSAQHAYAPPSDFCEAVLCCPPMWSDAYVQATSTGPRPGASTLTLV